MNTLYWRRESEKVHEFVRGICQSSAKMETTRKRSLNWTEPEKLSAIELINSKADSLFGKFRGASSGTKAKEKLWQEVADQLNSSGKTTYRTVAEIKKMYNNNKARAKEKSASMSKTGGGPKPVLTPSEEAVIQHMVKNNSSLLTGITDGLESSCFPKESDSVMDLLNLQVQASMGEVEYSSLYTCVPSPCQSEQDIVRVEVNKRTTDEGVCNMSERGDNSTNSSKVAGFSKTSSEQCCSVMLEGGNIMSKVSEARSHSSKRSKNDKEEELMNLEKKRMLTEISYYEQKKEHDQVLFSLKKRALELKIKKMENS